MTSASESVPTLGSWLVFNPERNIQHGATRRMWSRYTQVIAAKGQEVGVPAPTHVKLVEQVKQVELGKIPAKPENLYAI